MYLKYKVMLKPLVSIIFFSKIFKSGPKVSKSVLEWSKSIFQVFLTVTHIFWITFGPLWTLLEKNGLRVVMSASSLVLSSLLCLPSKVHFPATVQSVQHPIGTDETGTQEHPNANFYNHYFRYYHYYHYHYCLLLRFLDTLQYLNPSLSNLSQSITILSTKNHVGLDIVGDLGIENEKNEDRKNQKCREQQGNSSAIFDIKYIH